MHLGIVQRSRCFDRHFVLFGLGAGLRLPGNQTNQESHVLFAMACVRNPRDIFSAPVETASFNNKMEGSRLLSISEWVK